MSGVSTLGVEPTHMIVVTTGLLSPVEGNLLGVNRDVTAHSMLIASSPVVFGGLLANP